MDGEDVALRASEQLDVRLVAGKRLGGDEWWHNDGRRCTEGRMPTSTMATHYHPPTAERRICMVYSPAISAAAPFGVGSEDKAACMAQHHSLAASLL